MEFPTTSWYVARRLDIPPRLAGVALDRLSGDEIRVEGTWGTVALSPVPVGMIRAHTARHRQFRGRLWVPWRRAVRVELELTPWSSSECELGLRPDAAPGGARADGYFVAAAGAPRRLSLEIATVLAGRRHEVELDARAELEQAS